MKHQLSISQIRQLDFNILCFLDTSTYLEQLELSSPLLRVFLPDMGEIYYEMSYTTSQINILKPESFKMTCLPSGVYKIVQSVCPNDKTEVTHYLFHAGDERKTIQSKLCEDDTFWSEMMLQLDVAEFIANECPDNALEILKSVRFQIKQKDLCLV